MKEKLKQIIKNKYFVGSLIVTLIYIIMLIINRIYPFGEYTILKGDLGAQYVDFFCYLKNIILGKKGIFMSWNLGMANNFYTNFFWQLSCPLNVLVVFFDASKIYIFMELLIYIKFLLIFNFFILYIEKVYNYKSYKTILFGIAYTFSSYVIIYFFNIMWLDVLYVLPLSILFINNYLKNGKLYTIILTYIYMLFVQFYMAYSMIIFCSIYYVLIYWLQNKITKENIKIFIKKTVPLAIGTILSVGVAMIVFLPTMNILHEITNIDNNYLNTENLSLVNVLTNFTNRFEYKTTQKIGFAFCGSLITVLLVIFFINKKISIKEKILFGYLVAFLVFPIISPVVYRLWHGGTVTHGYNFRYFYLVMFVFVTMAFRAFQTINIKKKGIIFLYLFFLIMVVFDLICNFNLIRYGEKTYYIAILISAIIVFINITLIWINSYYKNNIIIRKVSLILILCIQIFDISVVFYYNNLNDITIEKFNNSEKTMSFLEGKISKPEIERIIVEDSENGNDSLRYNYSTFNFFASGRRLETLMNMNKIGYTAYYNMLSNDYKTLITDMMSGIKYYIINTNREKEKSNINFNNLLQLVEEKNDNKRIYKNNYCFPFAYYITQNLKIKENENVMEVQNRILNNYGSESNEKYIYNINEKNELITFKTKKEKSEEKYFDYYIEYEINALDDSDIYIYYSDDMIIDVVNNNEHIYLGDTKLNDLITWPQGFVEDYYNSNSMVHIVSIKKGEKYIFKIQGNSEVFNEDKIQLYAFDSNKIKNKVDRENQDIFEIQNIGKNDIEGIVSIENDGYVCFEIMYDKGWHIEIDGKEINSEPIYDVFLGAKLEKGSHNIKIYYIPQGFKEGAIISIISALLICILLFINNKGYYLINKVEK